jgi:hypothetical protein
MPVYYSNIIDIISLSSGVYSNIIDIISLSSAVQFQMNRIELGFR